MNSWSDWDNEDKAYKMEETMYKLGIDKGDGKEVIGWLVGLTLAFILIVVILIVAYNAAFMPV